MSGALSGVDVHRLLEVRGPLVLILDRVGRIVAWNDTLAALLGDTLEGVRGEAPWERLIAPEDRAGFEEALGRVLAGEPAALEAHWIDHSGARRWLAWSVDRVGGPEGALETLALVGLDRSEPERAAAAARLSDARFAGIVSISADAIISVDEAQRIVIYNESAERTFGRPASEMLGQPLDLLIPERFRARHREMMETFAQGPIPSLRHSGAFGLRRNGEEFPAEAAISKLEVSGVRLLTVAMQDITERRAMEDEQRFLVEIGAGLAGSLDPVRILSTVASLAVRFMADWCVADLLQEGAQVRRVAVVHADPAQAGLAERLERVLIDLNGPSLASTVIRSREPVLLSELGPEALDAVAQESEHLEALRALAPASLIAVPLVARGQVLGSLLFARSSRSRRYRQSDLRLARELAGRAATAMENGRLFEAAQEAIQARDRMLSVVAHDLRNPLTAVGLAATALARGAPEGSTPRRHAEGILRASARMGRLIEDLLDIRRIESGRLGLVRALHPVDALLDVALEAERPLARAAGLSLEIAPHAPGLMAWVDGDRLGQVFANLIGNAIKFTPAPGQITLGVRSEDAGLVFWVADTGQGIEPEQRAHLFDRFWQARQADRRGAGLGLPICKGIVEAHGGCLWLDSEPGVGSTFLFMIPGAPHADAEREAAPPT